jgi:alanine or glycine:cation symporter, AGCS family
MSKIWRYILGLISTLCINMSSYASTFEERINDAVSPAADFLSGAIFKAVPIFDVDIPLIVVWLIVAATFFTFYFRFISIRGFKHAIDLVRGKYSDPNSEGEVSHFKALTVALSGTVGLGNIAGVAVAVSIGGPGATIWMILAGFLGMSSKFLECTLGVKYRLIDNNGHVHGGPMRYLEYGLAEQGYAWFGKFLAVSFAICCIGGAIGGGNLFQANQSHQVLVGYFGTESWVAQQPALFGLILAVVVGVVIIGGIKSIANITATLVPFMAVVYVISGVLILCVNASEIPAALSTIFHSAFSMEAGLGGLIGAIINGFKRALFSSEAGVGSAAIAHSIVKTNEPVTEGLVSTLEPFIDTIVICTITALVLVVTGVYQGDLQGVQMTAAAFDSVFDGFSGVLVLVVFLFAFSTLLTWSYYATQAWMYLFGRSTFSRVFFQIIFCVCIVIGVCMNLESVVNFTDGMFFMMCLFNLAGMYILAPVVKKELEQYFAKLNL